jgi:hypothetical protein
MQTINDEVAQLFVQPHARGEENTERGRSFCGDATVEINEF